MNSTHTHTRTGTTNQSQSQILFVQQRDQAAVIINAMLNRNDKAMKALTVTLM